MKYTLRNNIKSGKVRTSNKKSSKNTTGGWIFGRNKTQKKGLSTEEEEKFKFFKEEKQKIRVTLENSEEGKIFLGLPSIEQILSWGKVYTVRDSSRRLFGRRSKEEYILNKIGSRDYSTYPDRPYEKYKKLFQLLNENIIKKKSNDLKPYIVILYEKAKELKKDKNNIYNNFINLYEDFIQLLCEHSAITEYCLEYHNQTISDCLNINKNSRNEFSEKYKKTTTIKKNSIRSVKKNINIKKYSIVIENLKGLFYYNIPQEKREEILTTENNLYEKFICKDFGTESPKSVEFKTPYSYIAE
jgi:hypothetical protein